MTYVGKHLKPVDHLRQSTNVIATEFCWLNVTYLQLVTFIDFTRSKVAKVRKLQDTKFVFGGVIQQTLDTGSAILKINGKKCLSPEVAFVRSIFVAKTCGWTPHT